MTGPRLKYTPNGKVFTELEFKETQDPFEVCEKIRAKLFPKEFAETERQKKEDERRERDERRAAAEEKRRLQESREAKPDRPPTGRVAPPREVPGLGGQGDLL